MAINRSKILRQQFLDKLLRTKGDGYSIQQMLDLIYSNSNIDINELNEKTIQRDLHELGQYDSDETELYLIQKTRIDRVWYFKYKDPSYSYFDLKIDDEEMQVLNLAYNTLRQKKSFEISDRLLPIILKLQQRFNYTVEEQNENKILFDNSPISDGTKHIQKLLEFITEKGVAQISYRSFNNDQVFQYIFHPYFIKEFNNRWFVFGHTEWLQTNNDLEKIHFNQINNFALDRILGIKNSVISEYITMPLNDILSRLSSSIGVTVLPDANLTKILFRISKKRAPYLITKKIHHSQTLLKENKDGSKVFSILVYPNPEMYVSFFALIGDIKIIEPLDIQEKFLMTIKTAFDQ